MEWITYAVTWIAAVVLFLLFRHLRRGKNINLPPGPKPLPIIGNLHLVGTLPHRSFHQLSLKYGDIMLLRFGSFPVVVGSSVQMAKAFLKTMDANFACRPKSAAGKYTDYNNCGLTWPPYGPYWRQARKICSMELFSTKRIQSYEYIRVEERKTLLKEINESVGKPVVLKNHLSTLSLNVICRMMLGKSYLDNNDNAIVSPDEFKNMINEWLLLNGVFNIGDSIPWLGFLDLQGYVKRMKAVHRKFDKFLEHVIDEHNETRNSVDNYVANDMMDVLLQLADDPNLEVKLERHGVKAIIQDLLVGGTDSSTITVEWAMTELLKNPEIFEKATEELDRVIGRNRWVEEKDMPNLPFIGAIAKETMRLHPVTPILTPRRCREDCKVAGYDIPKGARIFVNVWMIGRDPTIWEKPNEFWPERFIGKEIDVKGQDFELLPFGSGRRMCPGYTLGLKLIESSLANLLHGFNWKLPSSVKRQDLNMEEVFGLVVPRKFPLMVVPQPRLPICLYEL